MNPEDWLFLVFVLIGAVGLFSIGAVGGFLLAAWAF